MDDRDKEKALEALLVRSLRGNPQASAEECPDADLLAAYFERSLGEAEQQHWERHFAACALCQQALAALSRSATAGAVAETEADVAAELAALRAAAATPLAAKAAEAQAGAPARAAAPATRSAAPATLRFPSTKAPRRWLTWRWLVPAAGIAAAVALWVALRPLQLQRIEIAQRREAPPATAEAPASAQKLEQPAAPSAETPATKEPARAAESKGRAERLDALEGAAPTRPAAAPPVAAAPAIREERNRAAAAGGANKGAPVGPATAKAAKTAQQEKQSPTELRATPAPRKDLAADALQAEAQRADQARPAPPPSKPGEPAAQTGTLAETAEKPSQDKARARNETVAVTGAAPPAPAQERKSKIAAPRPGEAQASGGGAEFRTREKMALRSTSSESSWVLVLGPSAVTRWRIGPAGAIERWSDETRSWEAQASGVTTDLVAGTALSERVCWVVGRAGTILRTTDGAHWEKIASPAPLHWTGVSARDANHAILFGPQGERYATSDAGRTWHALPAR